VSYRD